MMRAFVIAVAAAVALAGTACSGAQESKKDEGWEVEKTKKTPPRRKARARPKKPAHQAHEHPHGDHPHGADAHHHHTHPHPHLAGADGHHHPY